MVDYPAPTRLGAKPMTTIRVVILTEMVRNDEGVKTMYTAVGLEHFITGQGETVHEACTNLDHAIKYTLIANEDQKQKPLQGILPAPAKFQCLYDGKNVIQLPEHQVQTKDHTIAVDPQIVNPSAAAA
jgi:hypothetical protein